MVDDERATDRRKVKSFRLSVLVYIALLLIKSYY